MDLTTGDILRITSIAALHQSSSGMVLLSCSRSRCGARFTFRQQPEQMSL